MVVAQSAGRPCKLSCAEAVAAALIICGQHAAGVAVLDRFRWYVVHDPLILSSLYIIFLQHTKT